MDIVGYSLSYRTNPDPIARNVLPRVPNLEQLRFEDFIAPYLLNASTPVQVYQRLHDSLVRLIDQQDSDCDGNGSVFLEVLANSTL